MQLIGLNPQQTHAVVDSINQNTVVLAGAGSGKTRTLTYRIGYLLDDIGVPPHNIVAVTFTNKAAKEMKERVAVITPAVKDIWIGTFHSLCVKFLHMFGKEIGLTRFTIMDEHDAKMVLKEAFRDNNLALDKTLINNFKDKISKYKSNLINPKTVLARAKDPLTLQLAEVYSTYQGLCWGRRCLDFDDLIVYMVIILQTKPSVKQWFENNIKYVMVDESQDTNPAQFELIKNWVNNNNLFMVGDDWQSIYSFRNANPKYLMDFQSTYPGSLIVRLEENYRSTQTIVNASNIVIKKNTVRTDKTMFSTGSVGSPIILHESDDQDQEAEWIAKEIKVIHGLQVPLNQIAILYRTNAQSRALEDKLLSYGIPYKVIGGLSFYDRKEIKDIMAYIRLYVNPKDEVSFRRLLNLLPGIGKKTQEDIITQFKTSNDILGSLGDYLQTCRNQKVHQSLSMLMMLYNTWLHRNNDFIQMVDDMLNMTGYRRDLEVEDTEESKARLENIEEFKNIVSEFQREFPTGTMEEFIDKITLTSTTDQPSAVGRISLMTLHGAKGLEYKHVFMPGCEEGILPHTNSMAFDDSVEEERRLFYVGMTRAMEQLYLSNAKRRYTYGPEAQYNKRSRFVDNIPNNYVLEV